MRIRYLELFAIMIHKNAAEHSFLPGSGSCCIWPVSILLAYGHDQGGLNGLLVLH
jgi:hypothetical protein